MATASAAFSTLKKGFQVGRDIESMASDLSRWMGALSDLEQAEKEAKNPPLFKKLFSGGSVEEEALAIIMHKKKLAEQEKELKTMLNFRYGYGTWEEMIQLRRKIRKERQETIYKQQKRKDAFLEAVFAILAIIVFLAIAGGGFYGIGVWNGNW